MANSRSRPSSAPQRGTTVILHLKEDAKEFADPGACARWCAATPTTSPFPVLHAQGGRRDAGLRDRQPGAGAVDAAAQPRSPMRNTRSSIATSPTTAASPWPGATTGSRASASTPACCTCRPRRPFDLWQRDAARGLKLYVRRVFIMDDAEQFLPLYLRFIKGVLDSSDLPLNVSRELLQQDPEVEAMRAALTRRALDMLAKLAKDEPEKYAAFWKEFGAVLKEGVADDFAQSREAPAAAAFRQHARARR